MEHHFNVDFASLYGVNEAIFCHNLYFWIKKNQANERHFYDGRYWTYNSMEAYTKLFPYWSIKQIRTVIANCEKKGLIVKGNYNQIAYDRTTWYALTDLVFNVYEPSYHMDKSICPNGQMEMTEKANRNDQKGKPIPDSKPYSKTNKKNIINKEQEIISLDMVRNVFEGKIK
ncbi:MAG: hypothetical protein Q8934_21360 [Bacillota bacterium]|nr:hypothetical protein [Bacillota bacterium]